MSCPARVLVALNRPIDSPLRSPQVWVCITVIDQSRSPATGTRGRASTSSNIITFLVRKIRNSAVWDHVAKMLEEYSDYVKGER